jgi:putative lipoprotein
VRGLSRVGLAAGIGLVALVVLSSGAGAQETSGRPRDRWIGADKIKHFALSFFVQSVAYSAARATGAGHGSSLGMASALTAAVGVGKEVHDRRTTGFSARDLAWDAAGAGAATLLLRRTTR